ncbi:MAG: hypothetical protein J6Q85_04785 [Clostridia bacterium]|nr:hypothetical protein [Clostridia bacterium]
MEASGNGRYANCQTATVSVNIPDGYIYYGMYSNGELLTTDTTYVFNPTENINITLSFEMTTYKVSYYRSDDVGEYYVFEEHVICAPVGFFAHADIFDVVGYRFASELGETSGRAVENGELWLKVYYNPAVETEQELNMDIFGWT